MRQGSQDGLRAAAENGTRTASVAMHVTDAAMRQGKRIAINGFGRIGRLAMRAAHNISSGKTLTSMRLPEMLKQRRICLNLTLSKVGGMFRCIQQGTLWW